MKLICKWLVCLGALVLASQLFPAHLTVSGGLLTLAAGATILWLLNLVLRPLLQLLCFPVTLLTLGLFHFVVNAWMVGITDALLPGMRAEGFWIRLLVALLITLGNLIMTAIYQSERRRA